MINSANDAVLGLTQFNLSLISGKKIIRNRQNIDQNIKNIPLDIFALIKA